MRYDLSKADRSQPKIRLNASMYAMTIEELVQGPSTRTELMDATGLSRHTIQAIVKALHKRKLIRIAGWERDAWGRSTIAAFEFGNKPDVKKPRRKTAAENKQAQRVRQQNGAMLHATAGSIGNPFAGLGA